MRKGGPPGGGAEPPPHPRPASVTPHPTHPSPAPTAVDTAPTLKPSLHDACPEATCAELGLGSRAHGSSTVCGETADAPVLGGASVGAKRRGQAWSSGCPGPSCGRTVTECIESTLAAQAVVRCCADAEGCILKPTAQPTALGR